MGASLQKWNPVVYCKVYENETPLYMGQKDENETHWDLEQVYEIETLEGGGGLAESG